jgi:hypothetical protein
MSPQVDAILSQIEQLNPADRLLLQTRLSELADAEWLAEAAKARAIAVDLGIDQSHIDNVINDLRYGT